MLYGDPPVPQSVASPRPAAYGSVAVAHAWQRSWRAIHWVLMTLEGEAGDESRRGRLENLRRALEAGADGRGQMQIGVKFLHLFNGGAERNAGHEVEGDGDGRQLADVGNAHRPEVAREPGDGAERHEFGKVVGVGERTADVKLPQRGRLALKLRFDFEDDPVFVDVGVNRGGLARAVGGVER